MGSRRRRPPAVPRRRRPVTARAAGRLGMAPPPKQGHMAPPQAGEATARSRRACSRVDMPRGHSSRGPMARPPPPMGSRRKVDDQALMMLQLA